MMVRLSLWADGELDGEAAGALQAHLAACPRCRARWEAVQAATAMLVCEPLASPAAGFTSRVMARVSAQRSLGSGAHARWYTPAIVVVAGLVGLISLLALGLLLGLGLAWSAEDLLPLALGTFVQTLNAVLNWLVLLGAIVKALSVAWAVLPQPGSQLLLYAGFLCALMAIPVWSWLVGRPDPRLAGRR